MSTPKKKQPIQATLPRVALAKKPARKAKPAKKPAARQTEFQAHGEIVWEKRARPIPPPPLGWEIVGKDDPRLKNLPFRPMAFDPDFPRRGWSKSGYDVGDCIASSFRKTLHYALPIAQPAPASPPMIRLRLPSEKPTREDGDTDGYVFVFWDNGQTTLRLWSIRLDSAIIAWLPGRLPDGILPREPTQEEKWRAEFEEKMGSDFNFEKRSDGTYYYTPTFNAWQGYLAAKKGGAE